MAGLVEDRPYVGMPGLPAGLDQMPGWGSRANPMEIDVGGGEPRGGSEQEGSLTKGWRKWGRGGHWSAPGGCQVCSSRADLTHVADVDDPHCHGVGATAPTTRNGAHV